MPAHLTDAGMRHGECVWVRQVIVDAMLDVTPRRSGDRPRNKGVNDAGVVGLPSAFVRTRSARTSLALVGSAPRALPARLGGVTGGARRVPFYIFLSHFSEIRCTESQGHREASRRLRASTRPLDGLESHSLATV